MIALIIYVASCWKGLNLVESDSQVICQSAICLSVKRKFVIENQDRILKGTNVNINSLTKVNGEMLLWAFFQCYPCDTKQ